MLINQAQTNTQTRQITVLSIALSPVTLSGLLIDIKFANPPIFTPTENGKKAKKTYHVGRGNTGQPPIPSSFILSEDYGAGLPARD